MEAGRKVFVFLCTVKEGGREDHAESRPQARRFLRGLLYRRIQLGGCCTSRE